MAAGTRADWSSSGVKASGPSPTLFDTDHRTPSTTSASAVRSVEQLVAEVVQSEFDATVIGSALLELLRDGRSWQHERASAFAAIVAHEHAPRRRRKT